MSDKAKTAYITLEGDKRFLCVLDGQGEFQKFPISTVTLARLSTECANAIWGEIMTGAMGRE